MQWQTVKTVFEIRFGKPFSAFAGKHELVKLLSNGKENIPPNDAVKVQDDNKKLSIIVTANRIGIVAESGELHRHYTMKLQLT